MWILFHVFMTWKLWVQKCVWHERFAIHEKNLTCITFMFIWYVKTWGWFTHFMVRYRGCADPSISGSSHFTEFCLQLWKLQERGTFLHVYNIIIFHGHSTPTLNTDLNFHKIYTLFSNYALKRQSYPLTMVQSTPDHWSHFRMSPFLKGNNYGSKSKPFHL